MKNVQNEAQQYVKTQESIRVSQQTTLTSLQPHPQQQQQQNRSKRPMKQSLFPPIQQNEEKVQNNRKIYRSVIVT